MPDGTNGSGNGKFDQTRVVETLMSLPSLLEGIQGEVRSMGDRLEGKIDQTNQCLEQTNDRVAMIYREQKASNVRLDQALDRIDQTNERLDRVVENTGSHYRDLERRTRRLEHEVANLKSA